MDQFFKFFTLCFKTEPAEPDYVQIVQARESQPVTLNSEQEQMRRAALIYAIRMNPHFRHISVDSKSTHELELEVCRMKQILRSGRPVRRPSVGAKILAMFCPEPP